MPEKDWLDLTSFLREEFGQCFWTVCATIAYTVMPYSVDAGVEEIMGLDPVGMSGEVVWVCFWAPGPPPVSVVRFDAHHRRRFPLLVFG